MRYEETVLFSDLDGTLFDSRGEISSENRLAIEEYKARGGKFAISTGREPRNAMTYVRENITNAPSVTINGSAVYDFGTGEYLYTVTIPRRGVDPVIRRV
nr:Cof-type HAD-IIB family hydrolase [Oscillospiraceae bacterium]